MATVDIGTGTTIVFGTSAFSAEVLDVSGPGLARESIETSHMGTSGPGAGSVGSKTFMPADLVDPGELSFDVHFNPDTVPPIHGDAETVTVTFPIPAGLTNGATWVGTGFVTAYEPAAPPEDKMTASLPVKFSGSIAITAAS